MPLLCTGVSNVKSEFHYRNQTRIEFPEIAMKIKWLLCL
jgi:hypothetical protein